MCVTQVCHVGLWRPGCCTQVDRGLDRAVVRDAWTEEGPLRAGVNAAEFWSDPERRAACGVWRAACGLALLQRLGLRPVSGPCCSPWWREGSAGLQVGSGLISWGADDVLVTGTLWSRRRKTGRGVTESWGGVSCGGRFCQEGGVEGSR